MGLQDDLNAYLKPQEAAAPVPAAGPTPAPNEGGNGGSPLKSSLDQYLSGKYVPPAPAAPAPPPAAAQEAKPREDFTEKYNTALSPENETKFQEWAKTAKNGAGGSVLNDQPDYDTRGRWQQIEQMTPEERAKATAPGAHGPDTWKKPSHITFSNESKYHGADGHEGGVWGKDAEGKDTFTPGATNLKIHGEEDLQKYFKESEPGLKLLPAKAPGQLPEALAPSPQPVAVPVKGSEDPSWATQALASVTKFPAEIMHGFLRGGEQLLDVPRRIIQNDWEGPTPKTISPWAGKAAEAAKALEPKEMNATKFVGNLLGGLAGFAIPGFATAAAGYELPFLGATLLQKFGSNLLTFGFANSMSVKGSGGSDEDSKRAMINTIPQAALFTVAQSIPFSKLAESPGFVNTVKAAAGKLGLPAEKIAESPWLAKIMEMGATGAAFAGSEVIEGQRDPASLAVSFLTGAGIHLVTGGLPQKRMKIDWEGTEKAHGDFNRYVSEWKETNKVNEEQFAAVKAILDAIKQEPIRKAEPGKPILDASGRPAQQDETQAALAKEPFERNAQEKLLADNAAKDAKEAISPASAPGTADIIPGEPNYRERANVTEPSVERLQRAVDVVGDSAAGKKLGDLLKGNQEDLANAFRAPGEAPGVPEITDKIMELAQKVEDTGDPGAAKELNDFINSNLGALKGLPRWPAGSTQPTTPAPPMASAGHVSEDMGKPPAPKATEPPTPDSPSLPGTVAKGPDTSAEAKPAESKPPATPAIAGGDMTEVLGAKPAEAIKETPATTIAPDENVQPPTPGEAEPEAQAGREPLRFDNQTGRYNGEKLERGAILTDKEGNRYQLDRQLGYMLTVDQLNEKGQPRGSMSFSVEPTDKTRYRDLFQTGENAYSEEPWYKEDHAQAPGEPALPEALAPTPDPLQAAKDFKNKFGSRQGAPEGLLTGGERMIPGERTDPDTPGVSFHDNFPRDQITVNADLWQHKLAETGAGQALAHIKNKSEWSKLGAGDLAVYRFPDGHVELMDGHSRINAGDRVGLDGHKVMIFDGNTYSVEEARATAALVNIMHETGTSVDSAKAIRDLGLTIEDLQQKGVKLSSKHTEVALGLSKLSDRIFADVAMGKFPDTKGAIIGQLLPGNLEAQDAIYKLILKKHADKNGDIRISDEKLRNDIRFAEFSKVVPTNQPILGDVFAESMKENLVSENSDLKTYAERKLANEKNLFKTVNNKAKQLVEAGNKLKPAVNQKISDDAAIGLAVLDIAPFVTDTETNKLFKEFAVKLQESNDKNKVKDEFYARLPEALEADRDAAGLGKSVERTVRGEKASPASPGEYPEGGGRKFSVEDAFGLNPQAKPLSKFEKRLEGILREYPDADPVKASMTLRGQPKATDEQIAKLAALTPAERDQVARGNLAATERQQLVGKGSDKGAQGDLFGGGGRGGDTLFKVGKATPVTPDTPLFHGQSEPFEGVKAGNRTAWWEGRGFYLTNDPDYAGAYTRGEEQGQVSEHRLREGAKVLDLSTHPKEQKATWDKVLTYFIKHTDFGKDIDIGEFKDDIKGAEDGRQLREFVAEHFMTPDQAYTFFRTGEEGQGIVHGMEEFQKHWNDALKFAGVDATVEPTGKPGAYQMVVNNTDMLGTKGESHPQQPALFKAGEEAAFTRGLTTDQIQGRMGKGGTVSELAAETFPADSPYARGWTMRLKNGQMAMVFEAKDGSLKIGPGDTLGADYSALGITSLEGKHIAGSFKPVSFGSVIELARGNGLRTFDHESWHHIEHWLLNDKERAALARDFGDNEEVRAEAYAKWNPKEAPNTAFQKILDFFQRMAKALTGYQTGEDVFAKARNGELFGREAVERGLPEALAPTRMKAEDIAKPQLSKAITQGKLTLEEYNARYADKYGEWNSAEWAKNFPDFAAMGVRMAKEDGTVVTERKYRAEDDAETRQGWIERGETPSFKQFKSEMDKDGEALYRRYIQPGNQEIPLYQGEKFTSRAGNQILDEKGKVRFLSKQEIFDRFYDPQRPLQQPEGTEAVGRNPLIPPEGTVEPPPAQTTMKETPGKLAAIRRNWNENMSIRKVSELSDLAQTSVVEHLGWAAREMEKAVTVLDKYDKLFKNMSQEDLMAFTDKAETGQLDQVSPELREAAGAWRRIADGIHFLIAHEKGGEFAYWQDWFPRMFKDPARAEAAIQDFFKSHGATMTGPEGMLKARTQLLLSNSIKPVAEGGLGLELAYPNYVDMMKAKVHESLRYLTGTYIKNDLVEAGFLQKAKEKLERGVAQPEKIPGWVELQDKSLRGYYAHPDVALVLDNFLSRGLRGNALFDAIDNPSSALRELFVGLSAFHGFFTTLSDLSEGVGSHLPRAIGAALTGRFDAAGSHVVEMVKALNVPGNLMRGGRLIEERRNPGSHPELATRVDLMQRGGIRVNAQESSKMIQAFSEAMRDSKLSLPRKVIQAISSPIMNYFVPRIKINAIDRRLTMELGRFREQEGRAPTREEETKIAQDVSREMDNIFGQMVYDNLGMKRAMRDVLRLAIGFPGWNIGSGSLMLESAKGIGHLINETRLAGTEALTGQKPTWEPMGRKARMSMEFYTGMVIVTAVAGALTMKMLTGNWPGDVKDVFMPQTGGTLANGQPERVRMPTYMRDILSLNHPVDMVAHKSNFPLRMFQALTSNQDYFGEQVRDPYASVGKQAQQTGEYVGKSFLPFAIQGFMKAETPQSKALNLVGITPVPREYSNSPAGNIIDEYNKLNRATTTTKESAETKRLKSDLTKLAKNQDESGFEEMAGQAVEEGKITRQQVKEIVTESQAPPGVSRFTRLPLEWATRAYGAGSDYEKQQWAPYFLKKVMSEKPENLIKNREAVVDTLKEMGLDEAADAVANLVMPEEPVAGIDLTSLGIQKTAPEMAEGMEGVDAAIAQALEENLKGKEKPTRVSMRSHPIREKKSKFDILGL